MSEEELVRGAQMGSHVAFRQLVEMYAPVTERTARVLLADRSDAEDAVQEAWVDTWRGLSSFQAGRPFRPWLLAVVGNRCRIVARRLKPAGVPFDEMTAHVPAAPSSFLDGLAGPDYSSLQLALDALDANQRQILALRFFADLQLDEIAELLNVPLGTVKSRLHRALQMLRVLLKDEGRITDEQRPEVIR